MQPNSGAGTMPISDVFLERYVASALLLDVPAPRFASLKGDILKIKWFDQPKNHDYASAAAYLSLTRDPSAVDATIEALKLARMTEYAAKDIFRASELSLLGISNGHVEKDKAEIIREEKLSPILLCRDTAHGKVVIADGYHRLCAVYAFDEDAMIPCKIV